MAKTLRAQLQFEEGKRNKAYRDQFGIWTIGYGHTGPEVVEGLEWTDEQCEAQLDADIAAKTAQVIEALPWLQKQLNEARQAVLLQMAFQLGLKGLLKFANTLASVHDGRYADAAIGMNHSLWAQQTPNRASRLAKQMETGEWV
jgi:lysozyme